MSVQINNRAVIVVAGRNVSNTIDGCLDSILSQDYPDTGVVFVDDFSTDDTLSKAQKKLSGTSGIVIPLDKISGRLMCWKEATGGCLPSCVVFFVNPGDRLTYNGAISAMMRHHMDYDVVWSQYVSGDTTGGNDVLPEDIRRGKWVSSSLISLKKFLFDGIDSSDFLDRNNKPFGYAEEMAVMFPAMEMAGRERCYFLDRVFYRRGSRSREFLTRWALCETDIRNKRPYGIWQSVTFIVAYRNHSTEIEGVVKSLVNQNVLCKTILVNAGSTDNTPEICEMMVKKYPTLVSCINRKHENVPAAKNAGAREAVSNFIIPVNVGDGLPGNWTGALYFSMKRDVDIAYTQCADPHGRIAFEEEDILKKHVLIRGCALIRKSVWEKMGGWMESEDERISNLDFWNRCLRKKCVFAQGGIPIVINDLMMIR